MRNWNNNGTGRPVAPLPAPDTHAVPATSKCAQRYSRVKRCKKQAAVTAPALGPPILPISAKGI